MAARGALSTARLRRPSAPPWRSEWLVYRALAPVLEAAARRALATLALPRPLDRRTAVRVLDLGCGERPWAALFERVCCIGVDLGTQGARPDVVADAAALPFADASFDLVFSSQVLEHVADERAVFAECARTLRQGGRLVVSVPFYWPLHEEPHDHRRFTSHGLRQALARAGFEHIEIEADSGSLTMVVVAALELLPRRHGRWLLFAPLVLLVNLLTPLAQRLSSDRRSTLNWVVTAARA